MPPKSVKNSNRNSGNKKNVSEPRAPKTTDTSNVSGLEPEVEDRFELELCWCIQQMETNLISGKLQEKQMQELGKQLNSLKSKTAPLIKKRQIMRNMLGDYREKMAEDERKFSRTVSTVKFTNSASADKKSVFVKKATGRSAQDSNEQMNDHRTQNILQCAEQAVGDSNQINTPFRFNFQVHQ